MNENSFYDLRIQPGVFLLATGILGPLIYLLAVGLGYSDKIIDQLMTISVLLLALCGICWTLNRRDNLIGKWFIVLSFSVLIFILGLLWKSTFLLMLASVPVAITATLIGLKSSLVIALVESLVFLILHISNFPGLEPSIYDPGLIMVWIMAGFMFAAHYPVREGISWWKDYFQQAKDGLDEARNRQSELNQALNDLADANLQLKRINKMVENLRGEAEGARIAKEQFVANVSHELRTPLNMVIGFSEMILQSPETYGSKIPQSLLADLAVIQRNASHLSELIDDVLDLSQVDAGVMALSKSETQISDLIDSAAVAVKPLFEMKGLYIKIEVEQELPLVVCDRTRIREVLLNLLSNAGRFTEEGGVRIRAWRESDDIVVSVTDTGPGIDPTKLSLLFQPFQQLDGSIRRRYGGTGLGLNISKRFVELHGGKIWVQSNENVGTTFFFRLPISIKRINDPGFRRTLSPGWEFYERTYPSMAPRTVTSPRIMVLDSGGALLRVLRRYMHEVEVITADTLQKMVESLTDNPCQLLIINNKTIGNVFSELDETLLPYRIPVILCSVPEIIEANSNLGVSDYLVKPIAKEILLETVDRYVSPGKTVLVVDDEPDALRLFRRMLASSQKGYRVLRARDGKEALNITQREHPDLILIDLVMPNMDGFRFLEEKNRYPDLEKIPVIIISARDPLGQPIISSMLAITQQGGLSVHHLLQFIKMANVVFSTRGQSTDQAATKVFPD
jgi:signal transduction histidine kinase/CheY-like chemotaxis protein